MSHAKRKKKKTTKKKTTKKTTKKRVVTKTMAKKKTTRKKATKKKTTRRETRAAASPESHPPAEPVQIQAEAPPPPEPTVTGPYIDRGADLPAGFGDDRIHAMVRDPEWVFVYWELYGDGSNHLVQTHGSGREFTQLPWRLRVLDPDGSVQQEIGVYVGANNWYVRTGESAHASIEIGFYDDAGEFFVAATTEQVATPHGAPSEDRSETWVRRVPGRPVKPGEKAFELTQETTPPGGAIDLSETAGRPGCPTSPRRVAPGRKSEDRA